jgi:hypothetical protein
MKKVIFFGLIVLLTICTYGQGKKSPIEGTWKMVYAKAESMEISYPAQIKGSDIKIWGKNYFVSVGRLEIDTTIYNAYVGGKYTLNGNKYVEDIIYHAIKEVVGQKLRMLLEIKNDTLSYKWPADENWKLAEKYNVEKFVRAE